jgi:Zn-dependent M28 family amino/carboxypeptidase
MVKKISFAIVVLLIGYSFGNPASQSEVIPAGAKQAAANLDPERMRADVEFLASDLLEGRGTGARGGDIAAEYIATQFALAGLKPIGDNGTYMQKVPLIGLNTDPESSLEFNPQTGEKISLKYLDEWVANDLSLKSEEQIDAPLVYVGYGVKAPEYGWDDYAGVDVKNKVVLCLVNDPPSEDPKFFGGKAMTYYGRWTYKFEEASRQGAAGILLMHNTEMAAYGWQVVRNSNSGEQAYLENPPGKYAVRMAGWITEDSAKRIAAAGGQDLADLMQKAKTKGFKAIELPVHVRAHLTAKVRPLHAENVAGMLEGSDPKRKDEVIVYTAHYDHLGIGVPVDGDKIYNGAVDNASGTALLLELARAFSSSKMRPPRSIVFLSVTGEERGLRGSEYYGIKPLIPAKQTMLDLNYDALDMWGKVKNVVLTGAERTTVWPIVQQIARAMDLTISPESHPEAGSYFRSDHFSLARVGIPSFSIDMGNEYVGKPADFGEQKYKEYLQKHYHQPSDEYNSIWDFSGAKQMAELGIYIGWRVAELPTMTGWQQGDPYEKVRNGQ